MLHWWPFVVHLCMHVSLLHVLQFPSLLSTPRSPHSELYGPGQDPLTYNVGITCPPANCPPLYSVLSPGPLHGLKSQQLFSWRSGCQSPLLPLRLSSLSLGLRETLDQQPLEHQKRHPHYFYGKDLQSHMGSLLPGFLESILLRTRNFLR